MKYKGFTITIKKGMFEGEECYKAMVREMPYLEDFADTYDEVLELVKDSIDTTLEMDAWNNT